MSINNATPSVGYKDGSMARPTTQHTTEATRCGMVMTLPGWWCIQKVKVRAS